MAKKARTSATVQDKVERAIPSGRGRKKRVQPDVEGVDPDIEIELDRMERLAAVCQFFCKGHTVREILTKMKERFGEAGAMRREDPYTLISYAASRGWLEFRVQDLVPRVDTPLVVYCGINQRSPLAAATLTRCSKNIRSRMPRVWDASVCGRIGTE